MGKYNISLKGLCCENCGEKIRKATEALDGVSKAEINVMAQKMKVITNKDINELVPVIKDIVLGIEPDVYVEIETEKTIKTEEPEEGFKKDIIKIIVGAVLFVIGYVAGGMPGMVLYIASYLILGIEVVLNGVKSLVKGRAMDENFLMSIATVGAFAINEPTEAVFVMLFYSVGEFFQELAVNRSRRSIRGLMELCPDKAFVEEAGMIIEKSPETVVAGEIIVIRPGERVPLDCEITEGESELDYSALTGESAPVFAEFGSEVLSGSINNTGVLRARVIRPFGESTVSKILDMV
ncbi:MAG: heavy metal translocating P-type ATPase, partial [Lachnospiraceae bacterium]|nr:heavy metal translocating P-type ATPase [Lachnospiraceae bacterium]